VQIALGDIRRIGLTEETEYIKKMRRSIIAVKIIKSWTKLYINDFDAYRVEVYPDKIVD
jgi:hypothetical protein